jgi:hypothetical protein
VADDARAGVTAVITAVADDDPRIVVVRSAFEMPSGFDGDASPPLHRDALPGAPYDAERFRTLQDAVRGVAEGFAGLNLRYVEQLYTFGDRYRDPHELFAGPRAIAVAYLALVREAPLSGEAKAEWRSLYEFFPWEDWRKERPGLIDHSILPALARWTQAGADDGVRARRRERAQLAFGTGGVPWDPERVLERYELLYEAGLVVEAYRDRSLERLAGVGPAPAPREMPRALGRPMARDGRRVLASALERLRGKLKYRPIVFELLPPAFTLNALQRVVEALNGETLHKQNFRRLMISGGLVEPTGTYESRTGGRPAELYRFRRQVIHERTPARGSIEDGE